MARLGWGSSCADVARAFPEGAAALAASTTVVTGANSGIGREAARQLARLGGVVVMACRSAQRAEAARQEILRLEGDAVRPERLVCLQLDLSDLDSVAAFAAELAERAAAGHWPPLRCLVLNAGLLPGKPATTRQGIELGAGTNHVGHFVLTQRLLPTLRANRPSRVVVVASNSHFGPIVTRDVGDKTTLRSKIFFPQRKRLPLRTAKAVYGSSKMLNIMFSRELNRREAANGVVSCALHPGSLIATAISRNTNPVVRFALHYVIGRFTKSINQGTSTTMTCAMAPPDRVAGNYFCDCQERECSKLITNAACATLWELTEEIVAEVWDQNAAKGAPKPHGA